MRLDFQLKALGHWSHLYSLSSVWTIMCCPRLDWENTKSSANQSMNHICSTMNGLNFTCTHWERSSHSLYTHGQDRRCPHVPVWSRLLVRQRWSQHWSMNTSDAAAAQVLRRTAHHSLHSGTSARLHANTPIQKGLFSHNTAFYMYNTSNMYVTKRYVFKKNISRHNLFRSFTIDVGILK